MKICHFVLSPGPDWYHQRQRGIRDPPAPRSRDHDLKNGSEGHKANFQTVRQAPTLPVAVKIGAELTELVSSEINLVTTDTRGDKSDFLPAWKFGKNPRREIPVSDGLMIQRAIFSNEV